MKDIQVLNSKFEASDKISVDFNMSPDSISVSSVHQVVKATLAGRRQGHACHTHPCKYRESASYPPRSSKKE